MKPGLFLLLILITACNAGDQQATTETKIDSAITNDTLVTITKVDSPAIKVEEEKQPGATGESKTYSNKRFKDVTVKKTGEHEFLVEGKGQIFEANFNWVIEDGHEELKQGHNTTDAGAPAWGNFSFVVDAPKKRANSTLHLVLFEISAKDGSRQHQLPLLLY